MTMNVLAYLAAGGVGVAFGLTVYWFLAKSKKTSLSHEAQRMREEARKETEHMLREAKVSAKAEALKLKDEFEDEVKERQREIKKTEQRLNQREENLEKKLDLIDARHNAIEKREKEVQLSKERQQEKEKQLDEITQRQIAELERVAELDRETAKKMMFEKLEGELQHESGLIIRDVQERTKEKCAAESKRIMVYAIQRYASECAYERTTATIALPSDEMKGRIIGRDGRNIRAIEAATGVSLLIDDTPEAVVISCFDPVRKEIARLVLERLISDGRIHPTRIEEMLKKVTREVEEEVVQAGEAAALETGVQGLPPQIIKLLGRLKFRFSFSQNVLKHSLETAYFMSMIAAELGMDERKAKRIGLLHDIGKAIDHEVEGTHASIGAEILRKNKEDADVVNAVAAHHEEVEATNLYSILVNACDALSASRPGARCETTELYLKRLEQLEDIAKRFDGVENCYAIQAGREVRVIVHPDKIDDGKAQKLAHDICIEIEKEMNYPGQIQVTVIRETRSISFAK